MRGQKPWRALCSGARPAPGFRRGKFLGAKGVRQFGGGICNGAKARRRAPEGHLHRCEGHAENWEAALAARKLLRRNRGGGAAAVQQPPPRARRGAARALRLSLRAARKGGPVRGRGSKGRGGGRGWWRVGKGFGAGCW